MNRSWKNAGLLLAIALVIGLVVALNSDQPAQGQASKAGHFTVVATDGTHLVVTDNQANKLFFYAVDQGGKAGDDLKLRGTINLEDVGKPSIKPSSTK